MPGSADAASDLVVKEPSNICFCFHKVLMRNKGEAHVCSKGDTHSLLSAGVVPLHN